MYDEKELIRECICGNRLAEKQLYEQYSARFFGICLRYAESREEAEDMLVGGFTMIFKRLSDFRRHRVIVKLFNDPYFFNSFWFASVVIIVKSS